MSRALLLDLTVPCDTVLHSLNFFWSMLLLYKSGVPVIRLLFLVLFRSANRKHPMGSHSKMLHRRLAKKSKLAFSVVVVASPDLAVNVGLSQPRREQ